MRIRVQHATRYRYSAPVFLEPHWVRMHPRCDGSLRLLAWQMSVSPQPAGQSVALDAHGNTATRIWFGGETSELNVAVQFEVETLRENPYDFLLPRGETLALPLRYPACERVALAPYLDAYLDGGPVAPAVAEFARGIAAEAGGQTMPFLDALARRIWTGWKQVVRIDGDPFAPGQALGESELACRDMAVLFRAACQSVGIAARFVSGYELHSADHPAFLHAWAEAYVPGGGWRGYDPSRGMATANLHIPAAAALRAEDAAPVSGTFRGAAHAEMEVALQVADV
ncbi:MAG: transglutaminase N-terminal domain-containing protein [Bryobacteraceae bacterium]